MKLSELKQRIIELLKEDENEPQKKYDFRQTYHYRMLGMVLGLGAILLLCQIVSPTTLALVLLPIPEGGGFTILNLFPIIILGYVFVFISENIGCGLIDKGLQLATDIKNKAGLPTYINDSILLIAILVFILYKVLFPTPLGEIR